MRTRIARIRQMTRIKDNSIIRGIRLFVLFVFK